MSSQSNIYPKDCSYGCNTRIYWNVAENTFFEVSTQKRRVCPKSSKRTNTTAATTTGNSTYYTRKPWNVKPKEKMSNSFELLQGSIEVQKQYEILSDIVISNNGKVHGSQRDRDIRTGLLDLIVYYEVPEGKRDEVKTLFNMRKKPVTTRVIT